MEEPVSDLITDHKFEDKPWAAAAWEVYGSELAGDIAYCNICNKPSWEHQSSGFNQLKEVLAKAKESS